MSRIVARGITNSGNDCYSNALIQCLLHCSSFVTFLFRYQYSSSSVIKEFIHLYFRLYQQKDEPGGGGVPLGNMKTIQNQMMGNSNQQEDIDEFYDFLMQRLPKEIEQLTKIILIKYIHYSSKTSQVVDIRNRLQLGIPPPPSTLEKCILAEEIKENFLDSERNPATMQFIYQEFSKLLIIQLKRFQPNQKKIKRLVDYPFVLQIKDSIPFQLVGIALHKGETFSSGHYIAYCKESKLNQWYQFNDNYVTELKKEDVLKQSDAYLLFYERGESSETDLTIQTAWNIPPSSQSGMLLWLALSS